MVDGGASCAENCKMAQLCKMEQLLAKERGNLRQLLLSKPGSVCNFGPPRPARQSQNADLAHRRVWPKLQSVRENCLAEATRERRGFLERCHNVTTGMSLTYRGANKGLHVLLSRTQAGPGRIIKQQQEYISCNHVHYMAVL